MKGIKTFASQTAAIHYFVGIVINAANRGWFRTDDIKELFHREIDGWGMGSAETIRRGEDSRADHCVCEFWGLVCLPILNFFAGVVEGGDNTMGCDFRRDIPKPRKGQEKLTGSVAWYGTATPGRFIRIVFTEDGDARMFYDTGYNEPAGRAKTPKGKSEFLNLPAAGDEDLSLMGQDEFYRMAHPEAN